MSKASAAPQRRAEDHAFSVGQYLELRTRMSRDPQWGPQLQWARTVARPADAEAMAAEIIYVICHAGGMKHQTASGVHRKVMDGLKQGQHPCELMTNRERANGIYAIWFKRHSLFQVMRKLTDDALLDWCRKLPAVSGSSCYHVARNLGADVVRPERWIVSLGETLGEHHDALCARLARASGDRTGTVDFVLSWAMMRGDLQLSRYWQVRVLPTVAGGPQTVKPLQLPHQQATG